MSIPKVTVCIPSYNHAAYLPMLLESILSQTFQDFEIVIVDDGSVDNSLEILEQYRVRFPTIIHVYTHPDKQNHGISATINRAIELSRGEYISIPGSDDVLLLKKLECQASFLDMHPECGMVYSYAAIIDENGNLQGRLTGNNLNEYSDPLVRLIHFDTIPAPTAMFRRTCLDEVGCFNESLIYSDWEHFIRILAHGPIGFVNQVLLYYRVHGNNISHTKNFKTHLARSKQVIESLIEKSIQPNGIHFSARALAALWFKASFYDFVDGEYMKAQSKLNLALSSDASLLDDSIEMAWWLAIQRRDMANPSGENDLSLNFGQWVFQNIRSRTTRRNMNRITRYYYDWIIKNWSKSDNQNVLRCILLKRVFVNPTFLLKPNFYSRFLSTFDFDSAKSG